MKKKEKLKKSGLYFKDQKFDSIIKKSNITSLMNINNTNNNCNERWVATSYKHGFYGSDEVFVTQQLFGWDELAEWDSVTGIMTVA